MRLLVLTTVLAALLYGCAPRFTQEKFGLTIVKGKTTKEEVLAVFGPPYRKVRTAGMKIISGEKVYVLHKPGEAWLYSPYRIRLLDLIEPEPLKIIFDENGVVTYYDYKGERVSR